MKKIGAVIAVLLSACVFQACSYKGINNDTTNGDTIAVQDTSSTLNLSVDEDDLEFAQKAANGNIDEIALGKLALQKGSSKQVKNFGAMMIKDHGKADSKLALIAKAKDINLPKMPDTATQRTITILSAKSGNDFDKAYINYMISDHEKDIALFTDESKKLQDPDLQAFAIKTLPVLQAHLDAINAVHDSMP
jgi:putative membrane protein